jgi:chemotaxis protein MotB
MDVEEKKKDSRRQGAGWIMTFADLMSLLMCFFVLLLSFSEMDIQKYKQIAGALKIAFGVQRVIPAHEIPKGTTVIAKNFSPGKPIPTIVSKVRQETTDKAKKLLDKDYQESLKTEVSARMIAEALKKEIINGKLEIETQANNIIIRIQEKDAFKSGSAELDKSFLPVLEKIHDTIKDIDGTIKIAGHTDDHPISTSRFRSNWELSTARALSVAHALMEDGKIKETRFEIIGYGDTRPRVPNIDEKSRAKNRRVVITVHQSRSEKIKQEMKDEAELEASSEIKDILEPEKASKQKKSKKDKL